jgi:hypothetical protein
MSRRKPTRDPRMNPDPGASDIRDPEQRRNVAEHGGEASPSAPPRGRGPKRRAAKARRTR